MFCGIFAETSIAIQIQMSTDSFSWLQLGWMAGVILTPSYHWSFGSLGCRTAPAAVGVIDVTRVTRPAGLRLRALYCSQERRSLGG